MKRLIGRLRRDCKGATAVEYGLILSLVVLALLAALIDFAHTSVDIWNNISEKVTKVT